MTYKVVLLLISLYTFFTFISCSNSNHLEESTIRYESEMIDGKKLVLVDSVLFRYSEGKRIGGIRGIYKFKNYFLIPDNMYKCVHVFDEDLNYIKRVGNEGRGPGEFTTTPFVIDTFSDELKIFKVLEKKICLYDNNLNFAREVSLPDEFYYQFRNPIEVDNKFLFSVAFPSNITKVQYYKEYNSLSLINGTNYQYERDIFPWDEIYHLIDYGGYSTLTFGVHLANVKHGGFYAAQSASIYLSCFDKAFSQIKIFGVKSKFYKDPPKMKVNETQKSFKTIVKLLSNVSFLRHIYYDNKNKWLVVNYRNETEESIYAKDYFLAENYIQIYNEDHDCIFDGKINGLYQLNHEGKIYLLEKETPEAMLIKIYELK